MCWLAKFCGLTVSRNGSLRGAGRDAPGPLVATWQIADWLLRNGPTDRETIIVECAQFVDPGYAKRWYARSLVRNRRNRARSKVEGSPAKRTSLEIPLPDLETLDIGLARRGVIFRLLHSAVENGRMTRDGDTYTQLPDRMPRPPAGMSLEQVSTDPIVRFRAIAEMELVRVLRQVNRRGVFTSEGKSLKHLDKSERQALLRWLETWDNTDDFRDLDQVKFEAIKVLLLMRDRQSESRSPKITLVERDAIERLWRSLDNFAT